MADMCRMQIGQLVDFCIAYNERHKQEKGGENFTTTRKATQNDINTYFG